MPPAKKATSSDRLTIAELVAQRRELVEELRKIDTELASRHGQTDE